MPVAAPLQEIDLFVPTGLLYTITVTEVVTFMFHLVSYQPKMKLSSTNHNAHILFKSRNNRVSHKYQVYGGRLDRPIVTFSVLFFFYPWPTILSPWIYLFWPSLIIHKLKSIHLAFWFMCIDPLILAYLNHPTKIYVPNGRRFPLVISSSNIFWMNMLY